MNGSNEMKRLSPGTKVVSFEDGEQGEVVQVCTFRRNGINAWSYIVATACGREIWEVGEMFLPE